ncbi:MAG: inositol monophosphatase family protein [Actinomycetota bacterium]
MSFDKEIDALHRWSRKTRAIAMEQFRVDVPFETKEDGTPVTKADREIEALLRRSIDEEFNGDAIVGEEEGVIGTSPRRWIIDPIDGTQNFRRGIPLFATLVALEDERGLAIGFVDAPVLNQTWWAIRDTGAFRDGVPIRVSNVKTLEEAHISTGEIKFFRKNGYSESLDRLLEHVARHRSNGDFWGHMLVAQGSIDAMIDPTVSIWDVAAVQIIVEEAGGTFTSIAGERRYDAGNAISSNSLLHDQILEALQA